MDQDHKKILCICGNLGYDKVALKTMQKSSLAKNHLEKND